MSKANYKKMTEKEYNKIKALIDAGFSKSQAGKLVTPVRSAATCSYIGRSKNYEDYKRLVSENAERNRKLRARKGAEALTDLSQVPPVSQDKGEPEIEKPTPVTHKIESESVYQQNERLIHATQQQTGALLRQAVAIERLADAWEAQPEKKGLFR